MRRAITIGVPVVLALVLIGVAAGGWYYANELLPAAVPESRASDVEVVAVGGDTISLRPVGAPERDVADLRSDHVVGFQHVTGYLQLGGAPVEIDGDEVTRQFRVISGTTPSAGERGDVQAFAYPNDPTALGHEVEEVTAPGPTGDLPGWRFVGEGSSADEWVVLVHGRGATRAETLRGVDVVREAGRSALVVSYRNDPDAPPSDDGFGHFGDTEWLDLQAWLTWLQEADAPEAITLYGYSQGSSIVAACLRRCQDTEAVTGAVLDSPLLSMQATLELQAAGRDIPGPVIGPLLFATKAMSTLRGGPDYGNLEHVEALAELDLPLLVFHGRDDTSVPFAPSRQLADLDPDQVTLVAYDGEHVRGWNADPDGYEQAVVTFLQSTS